MDRLNRVRLKAGVAAIWSLSVPVTGAHAQSSQPDTTVSTASEDTGEILVTAQKRSERLQDVPIQVSVLTAENIADRQIKMTSDIVKTIPSLSIERTDTYTNSVIVLRGISQAPNADTPVAVIVDGVPQDDPKQFNTHLFDVSQIEVLKGPQGSLYGRKAEAGAIIITSTPPTNDLHGFATASMGRGSTVDASAGLSGAIVPDRIQFRVAGSYYRTGGLIRNSFRNVKSDRVPHDWTVRGSLLFNLSDRTKLSIIAQHQDFKAGHVYFAPAFSGDPNDVQVPQSNFPNRGNGTTTNFTAKIDHDLDFATLTAITGYSRLRQVQITDVDFTNPVEQAINPQALPFQAGDNQPFKNRIFSQELRLVSPGDLPFRWLLSVDYLRARQFINTRLFFDTGNPATDPTNPALILTQNPANYPRSDIGASAQADYDVSEMITVTLGGRYDSDKRKQIDLLSGTVRKASFKAFQPKVSVAFKLDPARLIYATYAQGFRSGGFNPPSFSVPIYRDEQLTNYELGFKTQFFNRRLTLNGAIYRSMVDDLQIGSIDIGTGSQVTGNIDRVRIDGLELEAKVTPAKGISLFGSVGLMDPTIRRFDANPAFRGNVIPRGYKASFNFGADFTHRISDSTELFLRADMQHYSKKYWYVDNLDVQGSRNYVNGRVGATHGTVTASLWVQNLFNERSYETYFPAQSTGFPFDVGLPNKPVSYGIELSTRF